MKLEKKWQQFFADPSSLYVLEWLRVACDSSYQELHDGDATSLADRCIEHHRELLERGLFSGVVSFLQRTVRYAKGKPRMQFLLLVHLWLNLTCAKTHEKPPTPRAWKKLGQSFSHLTAETKTVLAWQRYYELRCFADAGCTAADLETAHQAATAAVGELKNDRENQLSYNEAHGALSHTYALILLSHEKPDEVRAMNFWQAATGAYQKLLGYARSRGTDEQQRRAAQLLVDLYCRFNSHFKKIEGNMSGMEQHEFDTLMHEFGAQLEIPDEQDAVA